MKALLAKLTNLLKPLWKGAAKKILHNQVADMKNRVKAMIDDDEDASIKRINRIIDGWQNGIIKRLAALKFMPTSIANTVGDKVQSEGDKLQAKLIEAIKSKGPHAVDMAFDGLEIKLDFLIDAA